MPGMDDWYTQVAQMGYDQFKNAFEREYEKRKILEERNIELAKQKIKDWNDYQKERRNAILKLATGANTQMRVAAQPEIVGQEAIPARPAYPPMGLSGPSTVLPPKLSAAGIQPPSQSGIIPGEEAIIGQPATPERPVTFEEFNKELNAPGTGFPTGTYIKNKDTTISDKYKLMSIIIREKYLELATKKFADQVPESDKKNLALATAYGNLSKQSMKTMEEYQNNGDIENANKFFAEAQAYSQNAKSLLDAVSPSGKSAEVQKFIVNEKKDYERNFPWMWETEKTTFDVIPEKPEKPVLPKASKREYTANELKAIDALKASGVTNITPANIKEAMRQMGLK